MLWVVVSCLVHALLWLHSGGVRSEPEHDRPFQLPAQLEFGISVTAPGGGDASREPPPKPVARKVVKRSIKPAPDPNAFSAHAKPETTAAKTTDDKPEAVRSSGTGDTEGALGAGLGDGLGAGSGYAPQGATIALNVDLARVRQTALVLETAALLDIIPEWQKLLAGSGVDPLQDLQRVFVASPTLERSSVVVSAQHNLSRARLDAAVAQLARERGKSAAFHVREGFEVADWHNRGPTARVIALTGDDQFTITRSGDLERVLQVASALGRARQEQGFHAAEVAAHGGLLAMQEREAIALWVEGVRKYVRDDSEGVPLSLRMSIYHVDQFNTELRIRAQYASSAAASAAHSVMDGLRSELSDLPKVIELGVKSAIDRAQLEQAGRALELRVRLTLHQTRYLMRFVRRALRPREQ